jgi:hypothetical protein
VSDFLAMDQNGDGFLTVEEVLRHEKAKGKGRENSGGEAGRGPGRGPGRGRGGPRPPG